MGVLKSTIKYSVKAFNSRKKYTKNLTLFFQKNIEKKKQLIANSHSIILNKNNQLTFSVYIFFKNGIEYSIFTTENINVNKRNFIKKFIKALDKKNQLYYSEKIVEFIIMLRNWFIFVILLSDR
jgi:hypothetical protein